MQKRCERTFRTERLEHDEHAARNEHAERFTREALRRGHVPHTEAADSRAERLVLEWKRARITYDRLDARRLRPAALHHLGREIDRDDALVWGCCREHRRQVQRPRADIEPRPVRRAFELRHDPPPPALIEPTAQDTIDEVITRRDATEHRPHTRIVRTRLALARIERGLWEG